MKKKFRKGDTVKWDTSQGETEGTVIEELTSRTSVAPEFRGQYIH